MAVTVREIGRIDMAMTTLREPVAPKRFSNVRYNATGWLMLRVQCTQCGKRVRAGDDWAGRTGNCPNCQAEIRFPDAAPLGWELPLGWEYPRVPRGTVKTESKYLPVVENLVANATALFLGVLGSLMLYASITAIWTGVLLRRPWVRAQHPILFWIETSVMLAVGSLLVLVFLLFVAGWIKRGMASVPPRFKLREMFFAFTVAAVVLGLAVVAIKFAVATIHQPMYVFYFASLATSGLWILGITWVDQKKGRLYSRFFYNYLLRDDHPWRFWLVIAARYLLSGAMLVLAIVLLFCAFLK